LKQSEKTSLFWFETVVLLLATLLTVTGATDSSLGSEWRIFVGIALYVLAGVPALRTLMGPSLSEDPMMERKPTGRKISNELVMLGSAAILIVYAAGYDRTSAAAHRFDAQAAAQRRHTSTPAARISVSGSEGRRMPVLTPPPPPPPAVVAALSENAPSRKSKPAATAVAATEPTVAGVESIVPVSVPAVPAETALGKIVVPDQSVVVAPQPLPSPEPPRPRYADGTYFAWGTCRHGSLEVKVVIESGQITSADINQCRTRYSCSVIRTAPPQVVSRQTPDAIDNVTGATQSVDAYYDAVADALNQAAKSVK
jgi:uncharacterized protein with FMN-binding domain